MIFWPFYRGVSYWCQKKLTSLRQTHPWLALKKGAKGEGRRCKYAWEDVTLSSALALPRHLLHIQHHHKHQDIFPSGLDIFIIFNFLFNHHHQDVLSPALGLGVRSSTLHPPAFGIPVPFATRQIWVQDPPSHTHTQIHTDAHITNYPWTAESVTN